MTVLSAVDSILVRATYSTTTTKARSGFIHCSMYSLFTPDALIVPRNYWLQDSLFLLVKYLKSQVTRIFKTIREIREHVKVQMLDFCRSNSCYWKYSQYWNLGKQLETNISPESQLLISSDPLVYISCHSPYCFRLLSMKFPALLLAKQRDEVAPCTIRFSC